MKKTYQKPTTEVVNVELQQFCDLSVPNGGSYNGGDVESRDDDFDLWDVLK